METSRDSHAWGLPIGTSRTQWNQISLDRYGPISRGNISIKVLRIRGGEIKTATLSRASERASSRIFLKIMVSQKFLLHFHESRGNFNIYTTVLPSIVGKLEGSAFNLADCSASIYFTSQTIKPATLLSFAFFPGKFRAARNLSSINEREKLIDSTHFVILPSSSCDQETLKFILERCLRSERYQCKWTYDGFTCHDSF